MADQFGGIAVEDKPATDQFGGVPVQQTPAFEGPEGIAVAKNVYPSLGPILSAFGHGAKDGWGDEPLGLPPESVKWLSDKKIFGPASGGYDNPFQAFNEMLAHTVVGAVQIGTRTVNAAFGAYQAGVAETGEQVGAPQLGRDLAAMPEAFFGSPHPVGIPKEVARLTPAEADHGFRVAFRLPDGTIEKGDKGEIHLDLAERKGLDIHADVNSGAHLEDGFVDPKGDFLTRQDMADLRLPESGEELATVGALPLKIAEARDLGVIGPPKPDLSNLSPADRAAAEVPPPPRIAAAARGGASDSVSEPVGGPEKAGNIRLDQIGINADAKDVILDAAKNNDDFNQARAGNVPLAQVESLSGASGVPSEVLTGNDGLGRLMHNDAVVRTWLQAFHQASDEIADQMATVARTGDEADVADLRDMTLRFQHMQEQVSGLTAEAGRTLGVFREFYANKGKAEAIGKLIKDNPGLDADSLKKLADAGRGLDKDQVPRFLRDSREPTFWDKYLYYWTNALISGPVTHLKYIGANAAFGAYEAAVVTPIAGALGAARRFLNRTDFTPAFRDSESGSILKAGRDEDHAALAERHEIRQPSNQYETGYVDRKGDFHTEEEAAAAEQKAREGVYAGEAAARTWGLLAGTPDALKAAWTAAKNNVMTPFENEVAGKQVNPLTQTRPSPIGGKLGFALGIPGRSAAGIHSFFRFLGYRAEIEAQAYRGAAKEGLSPLGDAFWQRRATLADQPTEAMMNAGIENGNHLTFIGEQGSFGKLMNTVANWSPSGPGGVQPFKLIMPFTHIPGQILRAGLEQTPAAFLDEKMRGDLLGRNGAVAADTARARLVAGGAVSGMVANWAVNDTLTGYGPTDPSERARWLRTHEPYSVRLGGWWYSYNKFGPIGDLIGVTANLVEVGPKMAEGEYGQAAGKVIKATSRMLEDEVGMQGLKNLMDAMDDPDNKMGRFVSGQAASNLPYSSLLRQTASFNDPYMREAKTFVDQLRYATPWARQDLLPKRDWLGEPMDNPGYRSIIRQRPVNADPVDAAVAQLRGFKPAPPQDRIGGVKLPPKMYDEYQATAGAMTRAGLEVMVRAPGWGEIPPGIREQIIHSTVEKARQTAGSMMQAKHPELIMQGLSDRQDKITGTKPGKLQDAQ
jgi:hypothetical protein